MEQLSKNIKVFLCNIAKDSSLLPGTVPLGSICPFILSIYLEYLSWIFILNIYLEYLS